MLPIPHAIYLTPNIVPAACRRLVTRNEIILGERFKEPQAVSELRIEFGCEIELFKQARKPCEFSISLKVCDAGGVPLSCETE